MGRVRIYASTSARINAIRRTDHNRLFWADSVERDGATYNIIRRAADRRFDRMLYDVHGHVWRQREERL